MRVVITGSSSGIGLACALKFSSEGHTVFGIDRIECPTVLYKYDENYIHTVTDVRFKDRLPYIDDVDILINNAGGTKLERRH